MGFNRVTSFFYIYQHIQLVVWSDFMGTHQDVSIIFPCKRATLDQGLQTFEISLGITQYKVGAP